MKIEELKKQFPKPDEVPSSPFFDLTFRQREILTFWALAEMWEIIAVIKNCELIDKKYYNLKMIFENARKTIVEKNCLCPPDNRPVARKMVLDFFRDSRFIYKLSNSPTL